MGYSNIAYSFINIMNQMSPYILLGFIIAGMLHVFVKPSAMSHHFAGAGWKPVIKAALLGIPLPLCSCGVLPTAVSLRRQGASKGATTAFLIATPQTGVDSIFATYSLLGLPFAIIRPIAALAGSFFGGLAVSRYGEECPPEKQLQRTAEDSVPEGFWRKVVESIRYGLVDMVASVGKWLIIGLVIAALITVLVPDSLFIGLSEYPILAMLAVVAVAIPMYICATGSIPIALSLMLKGLSPGIAFVMLMAGPAANFASIIILSRAQGRRATIIYVASVVITAIAFGLAIDLLMPHSWFALPMQDIACSSCGIGFNFFSTACSILLALLLIHACIRSTFTNKAKSHNTDMTKTYKIGGMSCPHCKATVEKSLSKLDGATSVTVDLAAGSATVEGDVNPKAVEDAVRAAGFEFLG